MEGERALVEVLGVLAEKRDAIQGSVRGIGRGTKWEGRPVPLDEGRKIGELCACRERTGKGGETMRAVPLLALDAGTSSGEEKAAEVAAVRNVRTRKK